MDNYMKLELPSKSQNEAFARIVVAAFAAQADPTWMKFPMLNCL